MFVALSKQLAETGLDKDSPRRTLSGARETVSILDQ